MTDQPPSRRAEYAEATRVAIVEAARRLFSRHGFVGTKVDDIAAEARVAPATVYAVAGGKQGLLRTLVDQWTQAPVVAETLTRHQAIADPDEILRQTAATVRSMREDYGDIIRLVLTTAPQHAEVAQALEVATTRYRDAVRAVAVRLDEVGGLREGLSVDEATDILWFYFGYSGFFTLVDDNRWTYERSERWLAEQAGAALG